MPRPCITLPALGARLRSAREALGLSQAAVGAAIGAGQTTISGYERGGEIDSSTLHTLCVVLKIHRSEWADLLALAGSGRETAAAA